MSLNLFFSEAIVPIFITLTLWCACAALGVFTGSSSAREVATALKFGSANLRVISAIGAVTSGALSFIAANNIFNVMSPQPQMAFDHWIVCLGWVFLSSMIVPIVLIACALIHSIYAALTAALLRARNN